MDTRIVAGRIALRLCGLDQIAPTPFAGANDENRAAARIVNPAYGTRCATVLLLGEERIRYVERLFGPDGEAGNTAHFEFKRAA